LVDGQRVVLIADTAFINDKRSFNFTLDNFYIRRGVQNGTLVALENPVDGADFVRQLPYGKLVTWRGKKILIVEQHINEPVLPVADYVLIKENVFRQIEDVQRVFGHQRVVFDNTTKFYLVEQLQEAASSQHLPYHFTTEQGAVVVTW
jgi:competence protein ComEC